MSQKRIKMNSATIKKNFSSLYEEFFSRSMIIVSAPGSFIWSGDYAVMEGGFSLLQKLPLRVYVGLEVSTPGKIEINEFRALNPSTHSFEQGDHKVPQEFEEIDFETPVKLNLIKFVIDYLKENKVEAGLRINIMSEVPPGCGLNMSGAFAAALSLALNLYLKKIKIKEVENWQKFELPVLTQKIDLKFDQVFRLAWKLNAIIHGGVSSGGSAFIPFISTPYPVVYFSERRANISNNECYANIRFPKDVKGDWRILDQVIYGAIRFEELFKFKSLPDWPIDFGLIYTGDIRTTATTHLSLEEIKDSLKSATEMIKEDFAPILANAQITPYFYDLAYRCGWRSLWNIYIEPMVVVSVEMLKSFKELFKKGLAESSVKMLFAAISRSAEIFRTLNLSSPIIDQISTLLTEKIKKLNEPYGIAIKPIGAGKKGDVLFVLAYHGLRDSINKVIDELAQATKEDVYLDYASWLDGIEAEGIKIEQHLEAKIYSDFISRGAVLIEHLNYNGYKHNDIYTHEEFQKTLPKIDLVLDESAGKIFVRGKQLTSKELHSAVATINILKALLEKAGENVPNSALPPSSYTQDRNELQSKIITPLTKILKSKANRTLALKIHGGIRNFTVKLGKTGVDIYLIKKVF